MTVEQISAAAAILRGNAVRVLAVTGAVALIELLLFRLGSREIYPAPAPRWRALPRDLACAAAITLFDTFVLFAFFYFFTIRDSRASITADAIALTLTFLWYEIYFYYYHRALHHPKLFWMHRRHHRERVPNPLTNLSFSVWERSVIFVGLLVPLALLSRVTPLPLAGLLLYLPVNLFLNTWAHMNAELAPAWFPRTRTGRILFTATYHAMHHSRLSGHFGAFTRVMDRLHGTEFTDYEKFHEAAR